MPRSIRSKASRDSACCRRLARKPGRSCRTFTGTLPQRFMKAISASALASLVSAITTSTSGTRCAGMKCRPSMRSRVSSPWPMALIGKLELLLARMASGRAAQVGEQGLLDVQPFGDALDHQVDAGPVHLVQAGRHGQARQVGLAADLGQVLADPLRQRGAVRVGFDHRRAARRAVSTTATSAPWCRRHHHRMRRARIGQRLGVRLHGLLLVCPGAACATAMGPSVKACLIDESDFWIE